MDLNVSAAIWHMLVRLHCYQGNLADKLFWSGHTNLIWSLAINSADSLPEKIWGDVAIDVWIWAWIVFYIFITLNLREKHKNLLKN